MSREEIMALLDRKITEAIETAQQTHGHHNTEAWSSYYSGVSQGLKDAKNIIGMLDKKNNRL